MGKRKTPKPPWTGSVVPHERLERPSSTDPEKYCRSLAKTILGKRKLAESIEGQRSHYAKILAPYVGRRDDGRHLFDMGDGWKPYLFRPIPPDAVGRVHDAIRGMDVLYVLQSMISKTKLAADVQAMLQCAFLAGYTRCATDYAIAFEDLANKGHDADAMRRVPKSKLTSDEKVQANLIFTSAKNDGATNNAAVVKAMKAINRDRTEKLSQTTYERELGIRA